MDWQLAYREPQQAWNGIQLAHAEGWTSGTSSTAASSSTFIRAWTRRLGYWTNIHTWPNSTQLRKQPTSTGVFEKANNMVRHQQLIPNYLQWTWATNLGQLEIREPERPSWTPLHTGPSGESKQLRYLYRNARNKVKAELRVRDTSIGIHGNRYLHGPQQHTPLPQLATSTKDGKMVSYSAAGTWATFIPQEPRSSNSLDGR